MFVVLVLIALPSTKAEMTIIQPLDRLTMIGQLMLTSRYDPFFYFPVLTSKEHREDPDSSCDFSGTARVLCETCDCVLKKNSTEADLMV
jgi:hypothetical protein